MKKIVIPVILIIIAVAIAVSVKKSGQETVSIYLWSEYISDSVFQKFEEETGIKVEYTTYDEVGAMYSKVKLTEGEGYDILLTSWEYFGHLKNDNLITPWNQELLPNYGNINPKFLAQENGGTSTYLLPFAWGTTGFIINSDVVKDFSSANDLWRPEFKGRILLANDAKGTLGLGLKMLGYSINSSNVSEIEAAYNKLVTLLPSVKGFETENAGAALLNGEADIAMTWNGVAYALSQTNPEYKYVYLKEGTPVWTDGLLLLGNSKKQENAHKLANFLLRADVAKEVTETYPYATANQAGHALLEDEMKNSDILYPKTIPNEEFELGVGIAVDSYLEFWDKLRTANQ